MAAPDQPPRSLAWRVRCRGSVARDRGLRRRNHGPAGTGGHRTRLGNRQLCHRGARQPVRPAEPPGRLSCFPLCALRRPRGERPPAHGPRRGCPRTDPRGRCGARALRANEFWPGMAGPPSLRSDDQLEAGRRAGGLDNSVRNGQPDLMASSREKVMSPRTIYLEVSVPAAAGFGLLAALLLAGCAASGQKTGTAHAPPIAVIVMEVASADVPIFSEFAAQTYARDMVEVRGHVEGYIEKWNFRPGAEVTAGQTLYVLDLRPYDAAVQQAKGNLHQSEADQEFARKQVALLQARAALASAEANLVKSQQDVDRLTPLVQADAASKQDLDAAAAALKANQANVDALKAAVEQAGLSTRTQIASMQARVEAQQAALNAAELNLRYGTIVA